MSTPEQTPPPMAVQQTTVINVGTQKSVVGAVLLAFLFGPLGMLYSTVIGAVVMFFVSLIIVIPTLGLGLIITIPIGMIWAGFAADAHNKKLGSFASQQTVGNAANAPVIAPAAWHDDPEGSGRLRWFDGHQWTHQYAEKPTEEAVAEAPRQLEPAPDEAPTAIVAATTEEVFCGSCGHSISAQARFCSACGETQTA